MTADPQAALAQLLDILRRHGRLAVAVSGGVDSMKLAHIAADCTDARIFHAR